MRDMHSDIEVADLLPVASRTADNTPAAVDLQGYNSAEIILSIGVGGITFDATDKIEYKLTHSDDDSVYTAVGAADMLGVTPGTGGIIKSLVAAHAAAANYRYGYRGNKRYLKLLADHSGTHGTGTISGAVVVKGHPHVAPVAADA